MSRSELSGSAGAMNSPNISNGYDTTDVRMEAPALQTLPTIATNGLGRRPQSEVIGFAAVLSAER